MTSRMTGPAQAADVDRPRRRLRVVDDLRAADPGREFVRPVHADPPAAAGLGDADDLVGEVAGRDLDDDLLALLLAEQGAPDRALVRDPALGGLGLGRADDRERFLAVRALDRDGRADLDVVGRVVLVDDRGVLDQRLERLDPALDERLLVLGVLVLGVLGQVAVFLGVVDPVGDLGPLDRRPSRRARRGASRDRPWRGRWACCSRSVGPPRCRWSDVGRPGSAVFDKGKNSRRLAAEPRA